MPLGFISGGKCRRLSLVQGVQHAIGDISVFLRVPTAGLLWAVLPSSACSLSSLCSPLRTPCTPTRGMLLWLSRERELQTPGPPLGHCGCRAGHPVALPTGWGQLLLGTQTEKGDLEGWGGHQEGSLWGDMVLTPGLPQPPACHPKPPCQQQGRATEPVCPPASSQTGDSYALPHIPPPLLTLAQFSASPVTDRTRGVPSSAHWPTSGAKFQHRAVNGKLPVQGCMAL